MAGSDDQDLAFQQGMRRLIGEFLVRFAVAEAGSLAGIRRDLTRVLAAFTEKSWSLSTGIFDLVMRVSAMLLVVSSRDWMIDTRSFDIFVSEHCLNTSDICAFIVGASCGVVADRVECKRFYPRPFT